MHVIYTIGHSTRPIEEFIKILKHYDITTLADIRSVRGSRHNPQYSEAALQDSLSKAGISYMTLPLLGGLRKKSEHSTNTAWRNASFRNYADYMQTADFSEGVSELLSISEREHVAIMCAEAVPWRCHRSLVGDALLARDVSVVDIFDHTTAKDHIITPFAVVDGTTVTYPAKEDKEND